MIFEENPQELHLKHFLLILLNIRKRWQENICSGAKILPTIRAPSSIFFPIVRSYCGNRSGGQR